MARQQLILQREKVRTQKHGIIDIKQRNMENFMTLMMSLGLVFAQTSCAKSGSEQKKESEGENKTLVVYFSATGNTEAVARRIAAEVGADTWRIEPKEPYTAAGLDWTDPQSRCSKENDDPAARPELKENMASIAAYDVVYVGYPVWWGVAPRIVLTFLESHDLSGKTVIPFCTSTSSPLGDSDTLLHEFAPKSTWVAGKRFTERPGKGEVEKWARGVQPQSK